MKYRKITTTLAALALPSIAHAHVGLHADGTLAGLNHPFSGLDHILAMVAVGFWASTLGGKAVWVVPPPSSSSWPVAASWVSRVSRCRWSKLQSR